MLFRLNSIVPAMSCAVAPKNRTQGIMSDFAAEDTRPRSVDARTSAATARPNNPNGAGSAIGVGMVILGSILFFCVIIIMEFPRYHALLLKPCLLVVTIFM